MILWLMSDAEVDAALDRATKARDFATAKIYRDEILSRLTSVSAFVGSFISGGSRFPLYEKSTGGFSSGGAARDSVADNAKSVASNVASTVGSITAPLIVLGIVAAVLVYQVKK